ncbi:lipoprotein [Azotobacter vinelandii CA]|uniref:Lipoprotein n=2 Tax=Azotobacter vinelandii TaxID=354 RepID=C1DRJ8_AZOVD|nr:DUF4398 domain-containing protein [Azotobacter vinelandii]ACO77736.1 lipoprotein [Azotobacter vinelandii DJ]AGK15299.1 lipoprotein [Azotobacter vinelandii CA]AGK19945.1 lipoprotein [Azotobacter vinelandii CA6]WKN23493.1 DUF4398 domain-containing protein [Azotobacter vinelandii]SFX97633.1 protein of unknown function [Azotobacter vinelandii]
MNSARFFVALLLLALAGCASDPAPHEQLRLTEQALGQARAVGAGEDQGELTLAQGKFEQAGAALTAGRHREARMLAEQAELDARLAEEQVLTQKGRKQVAELKRQIGALRQQLGEL